MDVDNISRELNRRFLEPLKEFYKRRIIFWYDEDREFEEKLDGLQLDSETDGQQYLCSKETALCR